MISIDSLVKRFVVQDDDDKVAVDHIDLEIEDGIFFTMLGPSGCGKTTTLRCIAGLEKPTSGRIAIGNRMVYEERVLVPVHDRQLGMVFQSYAVWPHMTVAENVAFPLTVGKNQPSKAEVRRRVEEKLELVGLGGLGRRMATQLSGGQQQRLSLARALVSEPKVLLLDEPLSNLDAKLRDRMRAELRSIQQEIGITTVFVTHDQVEALSMSDRVAVMSNGRIEQMGTPKEIYHEPRTAFVAAFIGGANLIRGTVTASDGSGTTASTDVGEIRGIDVRGVAVGDRVVVALRIEDAVLHTTTPDATSLRGSLIEGEVELVLFNGPNTDAYVERAGVSFQVRTDSRATVSRGDRVQVEFPTEHVRILPDDREDISDLSTTGQASA
jgi:ABC-type Fe3+/spermidine/putrescine transport system ATPase subunit